MVDEVAEAAKEEEEADEEVCRSGMMTYKQGKFVFYILSR